MIHNYDELAISYDAVLQPVPDEYVQLLQNSFRFHSDHSVIDLGCGSGFLTLALAKFTSHIEGLDPSIEMLKIAKRKTAEQEVKWINSSVESFDFGFEKYDLIIGFESFHQFMSKDFIRKSEVALKPGGALAFGYIVHHWEATLKSSIVNIFAQRGIGWGDWDYYTCPEFAELIKHYGRRFFPPKQRKVFIKRKTDINSIVQYLVSIDKAENLTRVERESLSIELEEKFRQFAENEWILGDSVYNLHYSKKQS